jgi:hypothetical protein
MMIGGHSNAHQFTPTYPTFSSSFVIGIFSTKMELLNMRKDVNYYQVNVYDDKWNPIPFMSSPSGIIPIQYMKRKSIEVFVSSSNINKVTYICSESKIISLTNSETVVASKICSRKK